MDFLVDLVTSLIGVGVLGATIWAVRGHFTSTKMLPRAQAISLFVILNAVLLLVLTFLLAQPIFAQLVGMVIILASGVLFFAAINESKNAKLRFAFDPEKPASLLDTGPYALVRHPFYVSYVMLWVGWAIAAWSLWTLPFLIALIWLYFDAANMEERNFTDTPMAEAHADYKQRVGFFWPKF